MFNEFNSWRVKIQVPALPPTLPQGGKEVVLRERNMGMEPLVLVMLQVENRWRHLCDCLTKEKKKTRVRISYVHFFKNRRSNPKELASQCSDSQLGLWKQQMTTYVNRVLISPPANERAF